MKFVLIACAMLALAAGSFSQAVAEDSMTQASPAPASDNAAPADLTGQIIYNQQDLVVGNVSSMTTDTNGQRQAVVGVEKFLGMGSKNVPIPVSSLQPRAAGGYTTSLSASDIKNLPEVQAGTH
jgi:hypothetical protein